MMIWVEHGLVLANAYGAYTVFGTRLRLAVIDCGDWLHWPALDYNRPGCARDLSDLDETRDA